MKIRKNEMYLNLEQKTKESKFLQYILDEILLICMYDKSFENINNEIENIDRNIKEIQTRISKQDSLLSKSHEIKENVSKKISFLDNEITKLKFELLEKLGS